MSYLAFFQAAKDKDQEIISNLIRAGFNIDAEEPGHYYTSAATLLAIQGDTIAVELLINNGANASHALYGAILGENIPFAVNILNKYKPQVTIPAFAAGVKGYFDFAEEYLHAYSVKNLLLEGAACGGHNKFINDNSWENIFNSSTIIAIGYAIGGHNDMANSYIENADCNYVARYAAKGNNIKYATSLLERGASLDDIIFGATEVKLFEYLNSLEINQQIAHGIVYHAKNADPLILTNQESILYFLAHFKRNHIELIFNEINEARKQNLIQGKIPLKLKKSATQMSNLIHQHGFSYEDAYAINYDSNGGCLYLIMLAMLLPNHFDINVQSKPSTLATIPSDVLSVIFSYSLPTINQALLETSTPYIYTKFRETGLLSEISEHPDSPISPNDIHLNCFF